MELRKVKVSIGLKMEIVMLVHGRKDSLMDGVLL